MNEKMKKIAIVTIVSFNYGNRLQNYALQQVLLKLNCDVETLQRHEPDNFNIKIKKNFKNLGQSLLGTKGAKFAQFDKLIKKSSHYLSANVAESGLDKCYDYFVSGSDQVWNPNYDFVGKSDLLAFARNEQKISYAASFGVDNLPENRKYEFRELLKDFKAISVREKRGAEIVVELTGKPVTIVLDPTMLIDEKEWKVIEKKPKGFHASRYALVYALGDKDSLFREKINSAKNKYEIIDIRALQKNGKEIPVGPAEFLYLFSHADLILTDSFHATVFALLFHKRFVTFTRSGLNMNSRIVSIANMFGLKDNLNEDGILNCDCNIDYAQIDTLLTEERKHSISFLKAALND